MKIISCCKVVPDEEQIQVLADRTLSAATAPWQISQYDLNAIEAGKQLAAQTQGSLIALSLGGGAALEPTKIQKDILSRGPDELHLVIDDNHGYADSLETAQALAATLGELEGVDLVLLGTGSADLYAQEVGAQLGTLLALPTVNHVSGITPGDGYLEVERTLEDGVELLEVPLPAVLMVSSEINVPPVPAMREIMRAGKKPVVKLTPALEGIAPSVATLEQLAPQQQDRRRHIVEGDGEDAIQALVSFLKKEAL